VEVKAGGVRAAVRKAHAGQLLAAIEGLGHIANGVHQLADEPSQKPRALVLFQTTFCQKAKRNA